MNYLNYPRIHFSGTYQANPSTINNTPNNWDPLFYPAPNELEKVELYWNPRGDGGFTLKEDCIVTQVDYADGTSANTPEKDAIIGQPVKAIFKSSFPLQSALVDLDPMQQNVSEIWAMTLQIGGDDANLTGNVPNVPFNGIWAQCQGPNAPRNSESGSAVFQVKMKDVTQTGLPNGSKFLTYFQENPSAFLSLNVNTNGHNNTPHNYLFNDDTFAEMKAANISNLVLDQMAGMKNLFQLYAHKEVGEKSVPFPGNPGMVPTEKFVKYMLQQYLTVEQFNNNIDTILQITATAYQGVHTYDYLEGMITGTVGPSSTNDPNYFVPSRMLAPTPNSSAFNAPFDIDENGIISLNLGNALPTETPGKNLYQKKLGALWLVGFPHGEISIQKMEQLVRIPYDEPDFVTSKAGIFTFKLEGDWSETPLGIFSVSSNDLTEMILLAEDQNGNYLRADQFVYRMNPGFDTTSDFPRGETNTVNIHALKFGKPVADGTEISLVMKTENEAINYTVQTQGTSGTLGVKNLSIPQDILSFPKSVKTENGIATFDMSCQDPGNPRGYVDGQVYFLDYNFSSNPIQMDPNDIVSVMVYDQTVAEDATDVLAKFGRLYKVMGFLADDEKIEEVDMRNMIKTLLQRPMADLVHMPVTRDLSAAARNKIVKWVDHLNNS